MATTVDAAAVHAALAAGHDDMIAMLERLGRIESPSRDAAAQQGMRDALTSEFGALGYEATCLAGDDGCDHLRFALPGTDVAAPHQLLLGHFDTVWPLGTLATMPVEVRDGNLHGPGVFDMKCGLVQMVFALRALRDLGLTPPVPVVAMLNADEELGSTTSRAHIEALARHAVQVLVLEPAFGPRGALKTARKGIGSFTVRVTGVASHAGLDPAAGASAILELSRQVEALFALNDATRGITVNVGTIDGGLRPNVIAPEATAQIEARVTTAHDADEVDAAIRGLTPADDRTSIEVTGEWRRPPMERTPGNRRLWEQACRAAAELGIEIDEAAVGGASDGNFTSPLVPTLDGLGAVGDGAHASHEHVAVAHMPDRTALLALLLMNPLEGDSP